jgi:hypothetical protein
MISIHIFDFLRSVMISTLAITKRLYQLHFTPDQNRPKLGFGFVMWLLWDRFILQIAPFLHRLRWLLTNVLQIFSLFYEFFDLFWKLQFWFQFISWFDGIQASVALTAMEANDIASVYLSEISMCHQTSATT